MLIDSESAWLEARKACITATKVAGILGVHPYETPLTVYQEMTGQREVEQSEAMELGQAMEPFIAAYYAKRHGLKLGEDVVKLDFARHPENPRFGATPDYGIPATSTLLECKWAGIHAARNFGDEESDEIPTHYLCQVQWQMFVTGYTKAILVVLTGFGKLKEFPVKADKGLHQKMAFHARKFLGEYIDGACPPPLTGHTPDTEALLRQHPADNGEVIAASYELEETIAELGRLVIASREQDVEIERLKNEIKAFMGDAAMLTTDEGKFTWKKTSPKPKTDFQAVADGLLTYACMVPDPALIRDEYARLMAEHTTTKEGTRTFRMPWKSERA
jgi:putative phage-type endonuclease